MSDLLDMLDSQILCHDGYGVAGREALVLAEPDSVLAHHAAYLQAGAHVIRTFTSQANPIALAARGLEAHVGEINWQAAQLAVQAARGTGACVAGCVGPIPGAPEDREKAFFTQIGALLDGWVNAIFFEGFRDVDELTIALRVKQSLHHCPGVCSLRLDARGRTVGDRSLHDAIDQLSEEGAAVVGFECRAPNIPVLEAVREAGRSFMPTAITFPSQVPESDILLDDACAFVLAGARMVGGGSPAFTARLCRRMEGRFPSLTPGHSLTPTNIS